MGELVDDIVSGRYPAESPLPKEAELGLRFGVSRTVVRESVKLLQDRGLVRSRQGVGTVVRDFGSWDLIDDVVLTALVRHDDSRAILDELVSVRAGLERDMARDAACSRSGPGPEAVAEALRLMEEQVAEPDGFARADVAFHDAVMRLSGNRLARVIVTRIHDKARTTGRYHGAATRTAFETTLQEHRRILAALEARDPATASSAMFEHITGSWARRRPSPARA